MIDNELLMQRAEKMNLVATDEEVDSKLTEFKSPYSQEEFDRKLKERDLTLDDFKRDLRRQLTVDKLLNKEITSKITISDADITSFYNQEKSQFNLIEPQWHLAQILVTTQPDPQVSNIKNDKAQNDSDAKKKIERLQKMLDAGEDFATLAMNYSEQPNTAPSGGDMGMFSESQIKAQGEVYQRREQVEARPVHGRVAGIRRRQSSHRRLQHHQAAWQGAGRAARIERPPGAAGDPPATAGAQGASDQGRVLRGGKK